MNFAVSSSDACLRWYLSQPEPLAPPVGLQSLSISLKSARVSTIALEIASIKDSSVQTRLFIPNLNPPAKLGPILPSTAELDVTSNGCPIPHSCLT